MLGVRGLGTQNTPLHSLALEGALVGSLRLIELITLCLLAQALAVCLRRPGAELWPERFASSKLWPNIKIFPHPALPVGLRALRGWTLRGVLMRRLWGFLPDGRTPEYLSRTCAAAPETLLRFWRWP